MAGARGSLPGNVISATVGIVYINLQPEYELLGSTRFEHWSWGHRPPQPPKETVSARGQSSFSWPPERQI